MAKKINHRGHRGHRESLFFSVYSVVFQTIPEDNKKSLDKHEPDDKSGSNIIGCYRVRKKDMGIQESNGMYNPWINF